MWSVARSALLQQIASTCAGGKRSPAAEQRPTRMAICFLHSPEDGGNTNQSIKTSD